MAAALAPKKMHNFVGTYIFPTAEIERGPTNKTMELMIGLGANMQHVHK